MGNHGEIKRKQDIGRRPISFNKKTLIRNKNLQNPVKQ